MQLTFCEMCKYAQEEILKISGSFAVELERESVTWTKFYVILCHLYGNGHSTETTAY